MSLEVHTRNYFKLTETACVPDDETQSWILYTMEKEYENAKWRLPRNWWSYDAFVEAVRWLEMTSSPGLPYMREAPSNGAWLKWDGVKCDEFQLRRLWFETQQVFDERFELRLRVFIKQEPHRKAKADIHRWRLIMAAPLNVQVAWQMCFRYMNDIEIQNSYFLPSQQGINMVGGMWKAYYNQWCENRQTCGMDKSAWDWTAPRWALFMDLEFRRRMGRGIDDNWIHKSYELYRQMFEHPILVLSDGSEYQQEVPGIMKSGCVNTISTNSHCQVFVHLAVARKFGIPVEPLPRCVGDDTLCTYEQAVPGIIDHYKSFGVILKSISDTLEFVGREFTERGPRPLYIGKHVVKCHYVKDENMVEYLDSMAREYCHSPEYYNIWEKLANALGLELPLSREAYLHWYDFEE